MRRWAQPLLAMVGAIVLVTIPGVAVAEPVVDTWYLDAMTAKETGELAKGEGVTVAVVDTGVSADHPELRGRVREGATVTSDGISPGGDSDPDGHGTAMAGLIAGSDGIAPDAHILPVRVERQSDGTLDEDLVYEGVRWSIDHGATVVNLSLAGQPTQPAAWKGELLRYAIDNDAVLIAAVGNRGDDHSEVGEPAAIPGVVAVSGLGRDGRLWAGSVTGDAVVLSAPAEKLPHLTPDGGHESASGTSASAALVSGVAALVQSRYTSAGAGDVINRLIHTADDAGPSGRDEKYGYGTVNARAALTAAVAPAEDSSFFPLDLPVQREATVSASTGGGWWWAAVGIALTIATAITLWMVRRAQRPAIDD